MGMEEAEVKKRTAPLLEDQWRLHHSSLRLGLRRFQHGRRWRSISRYIGLATLPYLLSSRSHSDLLQVATRVGEEGSNVTKRNLPASGAPKPASHARVI
jgi:hypothetical protein